LAFNLGTPLHVLQARPVQELEAYEQYTHQHGLPLWRIEQQLARIAMLLDAQNAAPGTRLKLSDYIVRMHPDQPPATDPAAEITEADADAAADALGFRPQNRRKPAQPTPATP
jgi:hypothetical protein